jgi:cell division protein FtsI/penicillin-binding protein 2
VAAATARRAARARAAAKARQAARTGAAGTKAQTTARNTVRPAARPGTRPSSRPSEPKRRTLARPRGYERRLAPAAPRQKRRPSPVTGGMQRRRMGVMRVVVILLFAALAVRLIGVQVFSSGRYSAMGAAEVNTAVHVPAVRGGIYDRNGAALALSVARSNVVADNFLIRHPAPVARALSSVLGVSTRTLNADLSEHSGFVYLAKEVGSTVANKVTALALPGINVLPATERMDPAGTLAAPLVGKVGAEGAGQSGLEYKYNSLLAGHNGSATEAVSPDGVPLPGKTTERSATVPGTGVELSIDEPLQYVTEQSLGNEILASHAKSGIAIVMNTRTGEILSMANLVSKTVQPPTPAPTAPPPAVPAAPGTPAASTTTTTAPPPPPPPPITTVIQAPQNLALTQVYEPGSVFKLVTFSAALQDGIISPDEVFTVPNTLTIDGWVFHDAESHPTERLTATQILAQSSNIGTIEIAQQLGEGRLAAQISTLGFGRGTGLRFPAESAGLVKSDPATWRVSDIGSTPIGQDDAVTAQQVLDMVNTVGTGGVFVPPKLVRATVAPDGSVTKTRVEATHRALSQEVASQITTMMEQVVQDGTAVTAGVPGYTVAGKTGTAQIPDPVHGGYIPGAYEATFAGFAPAETPALSAIVVLERPTPIYGGIVAAPVFSQIMRYALHRYGIPTSPGGGSPGAIPLSVPFPQLPPPNTVAPSPPSPPSPTTTTTTIVASHGKLTQSA